MFEKVFLTRDGASLTSRGDKNGIEVATVWDPETRETRLENIPATLKNVREFQKIIEKVPKTMELQEFLVKLSVTIPDLSDLEMVRMFAGGQNHLADELSVWNSQPDWIRDGFVWMARGANPLEFGEQYLNYVTRAKVGWEIATVGVPGAELAEWDNHVLIASFIERVTVNDKETAIAIAALSENFETLKNAKSRQDNKIIALACMEAFARTKDQVQPNRIEGFLKNTWKNLEVVDLMNAFGYTKRCVVGRKDVLGRGVGNDKFYNIAVEFSIRTKKTHVVWREQDEARAKRLQKEAVKLGRIFHTERLQSFAEQIAKGVSEAKLGTVVRVKNPAAGTEGDGAQLKVTLLQIFVTKNPTLFSAHRKFFGVAEQSQIEVFDKGEWLPLE